MAHLGLIKIKFSLFDNTDNFVPSFVVFSLISQAKCFLSL